MSGRSGGGSAGLGAGAVARLGSRASGSSASLRARGRGVSAGRGGGGVGVGGGVVAASSAGSLRGALGGDEVVFVDALVGAVAKGLDVSSGALALGAVGDTLGGGVGLGAVGRGDLLDV